MIEREEKTKEIIREAEYPVSIGYVAGKLGVAWATARSTLLALAVEKEISVRRTGNGWIFYEKTREDG